MLGVKITPQYIVDKDGHETAAVIPIDQWRRLQRKLERQQWFEKLKSDIKEGLEEVRAIQEGRATAKDAKDMIRELRSRRIGSV